MTERRPRIVVAEKYGEKAMARLRAAGEVIEPASYDEAALAEALKDADALLVRSYARVTARLIDEAPRLRVIGRGGVGVENIDHAAAAARGIVVVYTPAASTHSVAVHTIGLILATLRRFPAGAAAVREAGFHAFRSSARFLEMEDATLGVVGMGRIGSTAARIAAVGLGMRVIYNDIVEVGPFDFPSQAVTKDQLFAEADVVSLHVPLTRQTRHLVNRQTLSRFRPTAVLINTARGAVVDGMALAEALHGGKLAGAGLDVFESEPPPADHPILSAPNVVLTPHVAGRTGPARERMEDVVDDVIAVLEGRTPRYRVES